MNHRALELAVVLVLAAGCGRTGDREREVADGLVGGPATFDMDYEQYAAVEDISARSTAFVKATVIGVKPAAVLGERTFDVPGRSRGRIYGDTCRTAS